MSGKCQTVIQSSVHQRPGFRPGFWCQVAVRLLYDLPCTKNLISCQGFDVWLLLDSYTIFHDPKACLHARVLMSVNWQTVVQPSMHQRPCFFQGFNVRQLSDTCTTFYTPNTWLEASVLIYLLLMLFCCLTSMINSMSWCHVCVSDIRLSVCPSVTNRVRTITLQPSKILLKLGTNIEHHQAMCREQGP